MKYDSALGELKNLLPQAQNVLIVLPQGSDIDRFASGLALFLSLKQAGKQVTIASDDTILVAQSHLFGVDQIKSTLPQAGSNNFVLTLEGVASTDGTIPSLEKLDWQAENQNLNLIFHVLPGQTFQPTKIVPQYPTEGANFNLIFTIGAASLANLGNLYSQNSQIFSGTHLVNLDNQNTNTNFGQTNVVDPNASSISEMLTDLIPSLNLLVSGDTASNLLAGIFDATGNLTNQKVTADTYLAVGTALRMGGQKPVENPKAGSLDLSGLMPNNSQQAEFTMPPVVPSVPVIDTQNMPSPEERPSGEIINDASVTPEPVWLTPKVFKGTSIG